MKKNNKNKLKIKCEIYSRPCGFYRPVNSWNLGKKEEYKERKMLNVNSIKKRKFL